MASGAIPDADGGIVAPTAAGPESGTTPGCYSPAHPLSGVATGPVTMSVRVLACLLWTAGLAACSDPPPSAPTAHASIGSDTVQQPQFLDDITRTELSRTGFQLTNDLEFLGSRSDAGIDRQVAFAVRMPASRVQSFLEAAGFDTPLKPGQRVFQTPVEGVDTAGAKQVSAGQDVFRTDGGSLTRDVMVIHEDAGTAIVHVWAYTT